MPNEIRVDHDVAAAKSKALAEYADLLKAETAKHVAAVTNAMKEESSANTRDGQPAPIFADVNTALTAFLERVSDRVDVISGELVKDSEAIAGLNKDAQEVGNEAAKQINKVESGK